MPWKQATRLRNRIVHGYWNISAQIVHDVATLDLPPMIEALDSVLIVLTSRSSPSAVDEAITES